MKPFAYKLKIEFPEPLLNNVQAFLYEKGFSTFQEGEAGIDEQGNITLVNENTLITLASENEDSLKILGNDIKTQFPNVHLTLDPVLEDFNNAWKEFSKPIHVSNSILIQPTWIPLEEEKELTIYLDPGLAFGSGGHETTLLCLREIEKVIKLENPTSVLDVGCGSGILSILAKKLGVPNVIGVDIDELAVIASKENASRNGVNDIDFNCKTLLTLPGKFDLVIANIISSILNDLMIEIKSHLKVGGSLILSGLLKEECQEFINRHKLHGFHLETLGEWSLLSGKFLQ